MGSLFRSQDMSLISLCIQRVAAHDTIDELGYIESIQFKDLNPEQSAFQRAFARDVKRCDEMQRRVRYLIDQAQTIPSIDASTLTSTMNYADAQNSAAKRNQLDAIKMDALDTDLEGLEKTIKEMNSHWEALKVQKAGLTELKQVLEKGAELFRNAPNSEPSTYGTLSTDPLAVSTTQQPGYSSSTSVNITESTSLVRADALAGQGIVSTAPPSMLSFHMGVILNDRVPAFERVVFRASKGNAYVKISPITEKIPDPLTGELLDKSVYVIFFSGIEVGKKVDKICIAFDAAKYPFPENHADQMKAYTDCRNRLKDLDSVLITTEQQRKELLVDLSTKLPVWNEKITHEKAIFHTLNLFNFDTSQKIFVAEGWCPANAIGDIQNALERGRKKSNAQVPSVLEIRSLFNEVPPTYFKTNRFTQVFQGIVESYGVAEYKEANPAVFTVITFPFLFAVMFGDIGHGILMALFAFTLIFKEKELARQKLNELLETCYDGRYIIFLMGLFSIYTGFLYNEFFAIPLDVFGSRWKYTDASQMACGIDNCHDPAKVMPPLNPYPFGFDPIWKPSQTGLLFFNSYKMKLSIVFGVTQMTMGIVVSYFNARYFKRAVDVYYVFIPQMIFLLSIFGYLVFLIILKWSIDFNAPSCISDPTCVPPDLKAILIGMFMSPGNLPPELTLFPGQATVQVILLIMAFVAVPWMLLPKPFILKARHEQKMKLKKGADEEVQATSDSHGHDDEFDFSDVFVNQAIHTIEFVLGAVSNTASYLRLWALSLAHAQLSDVFLEKLMLMTIETGSPIAIFIGFFLWVAMTIGVLMLMESLSAFLHALRLHWVEFQNKFYNLHDTGIKFTPFSYVQLAQEEQ